MTAIVMASMGAAAVTVAALETTVTVGNDEWFDAGTLDTFFNYGYSGGGGTGTLTDADPMGSISDDTYVDAGSTTRTVAHIYWAEDTGGIASSDLEDTIFFGLVGTSIPNNDTTFKQIEYNGVTYTRASADQYDASVGSVNTVWRWNNVSPNGPTAGVRDFKVVL